MTSAQLIKSIKQKQLEERGKVDTLYEIDDRYHAAEADAMLTVVPEEQGTRRIGLAVIGVGRMGAIHMYNALRLPRAKPLYVLDNDPKRLNYMRKKYYLDERGVKTVGPEDYQKILDDPEVEALLISTPTYTHESYARQGLEHGKHIICEKPLADKVESVQALVELAEKKKLKLICAFNRRYDPTFRQIHSQVQRGEIGQLRLIKTCSRDSPLPHIEYIKISGGIFHDCMVHDADVVLWFAKELPCEVHCYAHCYMPDYAELNDYDTALCSMKFPSGLMAVIDLARVNASGYDQRVEVYGPDGCIKLDELNRLGWEKHSETGITKPSNCYSFASRYLEAYANELMELFNHIENNKVMEPIRPGYLSALCKVIHACEESARTQRVIKLDWSKEELALSL